MNRQYSFDEKSYLMKQAVIHPLMEVIKNWRDYFVVYKLLRKFFQARVLEIGGRLAAVGINK